jgi:hypothetical protein
VNSDGELLSIDEGDIFGKRKNIFNKNDWCNKNNINDTIFNEVLEDFLINMKYKEENIIKKMINYDLDIHIHELKKRIKDYKKIVYNEWYNIQC